jgi:polysaccharide chain length determinant protein (PEP-CTERM system associated)
MPQLPANLPLDKFQDLRDSHTRDHGSAFDIRYYIGLFLRRRWFMIISFCIAMIAGIYLAITLPRMYQTETLIFVEPQQVPDNYVQAIVSAGLDVRLNNIVEMIMSRTNLMNIIEKFKLFSGPEFESMFLEEKVAEMRKRTSVDLISDKRSRSPSNMFTISFKGEDPEKVVKVVNAMTTLVINQNLKLRELQAVGTTQFLEDELTKMRKRLETVEATLKDFRRKHMGELPEQLTGNIMVLDRQQQQMSEKQQSLRDEKNRLISIENQLQLARAEPPAAEVSALDRAEPTTPEELRQLLADYQSRYTKQHPDVIRLKHRIYELEKETLPAASDRDTAARPPAAGRVGRSNQGLSMESELIVQRGAVNREIAAIKDEISELQTQVAIYQQRVEATPKIEQELLSLKRDYENIQETYKSLLERKLEADIAANMEKRQQGERFRILDPARLPDKPISPDMKKLFLLCVVTGLGLGGGLIFLLEFLDNSVRKPESVPAKLGIPVLVAVPSIERRKDVIWRRMNMVLSIFGSLVSLALLACFAAVSILDMQLPIDLIKNYISM